MITLTLLFLITACIYSSVGFGGGSTYLALLLLWGVPFTVFPVIALCCNIIVVLGNCINYTRAGNLNFRLIAPYLIGSVPLAYVGGSLAIEKDIFEILLFFVLSIAGLLLLAKGLQKYGKQIAEAVAPIIDGLKIFFERLSQDIGPLLSDAFSIISDTFTGIFNLVKGIFTLDGDLIKEGFDSLKTIPLRIATFLLDAVASIINSIGAAFGVEGDITTNIKNFFIDIKNKVVESFNNVLAFFTEDIQVKVTEIKDSITGFFTDAFDKIKNGVKDAFSSVGNFFSDIGDSVKTLINSAIEALPLPKFLKKKLKLDTKASKEADERISETGIKGKYTDDSITGMQRERMTGGMGTMEEGFAEATGEKYGTARITKSGTAGYDFASGVLTPEQFTEYNKLDTDGQLEYLKNLDEEELLKQI